MKKIILVFMMVLAWGALQAKGVGGYDYVVTSDGTYYCEKIDMGKSETKLVLNTGQALTVRSNEIIAYKLQGKIFEKVPVFSHNLETGKQAYMELIAIRGGHKLYRYGCGMGNFQVQMGSNANPSGSCRLFVFKNGTYHMEVNRANYPTVLDFFKIKTA